MDLDEQVRKDLVFLTIEKVLLDIGKPTYYEVIYALFKNFHCNLSDCYEKPEYLKQVLVDLYGNSATSIIDSIQENLRAYSDQDGIKVFVSGIRV